MLTIEYVGHYPGTSNCPNFHLFRNVATDEMFMLSQQLMQVMGKNLAIPNWNRLAYEANQEREVQSYRMRFRGNELRDFKNLLQNHQIFDYQRCSQLLCLSETGLAFWLGQTSREPILRLGDWLWNKILVTARNYNKFLYYQNIRSEYIQSNLHVFIHQGRLGLLEFELYRIFPNHPSLDYVSLICGGYLPNVHFTRWSLAEYKKVCLEVPGINYLDANVLEQKNNILFLYESGIYRYLQQHSYDPNSVLIKQSFEREILPAFRHATYLWMEINNVFDERQNIQESRSTFDIEQPTAAETRLVWPSNVAYQEHLSKHSSEQQNIMGYLQKIEKSLQDFSQQTGQNLVRTHELLQTGQQQLFGNLNQQSQQQIKSMETTLSTLFYKQETFLKSDFRILLEEFYLKIKNFHVKPLEPKHVPAASKATDNSPVISKATDNSPVINKATDNIPVANKAIENVPPVNKINTNIPMQESFAADATFPIAADKIAPIGSTTPTPSLFLLKEIAISLGLYYRDRVTPHTTFVRHLLNIIKSIDISVIRTYINQKIPLQDGANSITLVTTVYQIWKK